MIHTRRTPFSLYIVAPANTIFGVRRTGAQPSVLLQNDGLDPSLRWDDGGPFACSAWVFSR